MTTLVEDYATIDEAAALMRVAPSTIRRWIREGTLPAFRVGQRRLAVKRTDLADLIRPAGTDRENGGGATDVDRFVRRRLTPEEQERGLAAFERAQRLSRQILERRGGQPFPPSWQVLDELRDERSRQLT